MSDPIREASQEVHLHPDTVASLRDGAARSADSGRWRSAGLLMGGLDIGMNVIADERVAPGAAIIVDRSGVTNVMDLGNLTPTEAYEKLGMKAQTPRTKLMDMHDELDLAATHFEKIQRAPGGAQCKDCLSFNVHVEVTRTFGGETTYIGRCDNCGLSETAEFNMEGAARRTVSSGTTTMGHCSRCDVQQRVTALTRVAHRTRDEVTTMLDLCSGCSVLTLCVASRDGKHEHPIPITSLNHTPPTRMVGPLPESVPGAWCLDCRTSLYWVWTDGCTGVWAELTWSLLADLWESQP